MIITYKRYVSTLRAKQKKSRGGKIFCVGASVGISTNVTHDAILAASPLNLPVTTESFSSSYK